MGGQGGGGQVAYPSPWTAQGRLGKGGDRGRGGFVAPGSPGLGGCSPPPAAVHTHSQVRTGRPPRPPPPIPSSDRSARGPVPVPGAAKLALNRQGAPGLDAQFWVYCVVHPPVQPMTALAGHSDSHTPLLYPLQSHFPLAALLTAWIAHLQLISLQVLPLSVT